MAEWKNIKGKRFKEGEVVDIWSPDYGRLPNYRFRKDYSGNKGNNFFEPVHAGYSCTRNATHWMPLPEAPE